jgi:hypothetical protein
MMRFSEETLMAYADRELDGEMRARVDAAIADDSDLADAVALQIENRQALSLKLHAAFDEALQEQVPDRLVKAADSSTGDNSFVADVPGAGPDEASASRRAVRQWSVIGGSLVIGALFGHFVLDGDRGPIMTEGGRMTAHGELSDALSQQSGGALDRNTGIQIGVSYLAKTSEYCRTFMMKSEGMLAGLACRRQNAWAIDALTRTNANASGAYRMAGAAIPALLLGIVESTIAGNPLDAEQEAEARERGWQR